MEIHTFSIPFVSVSDCLLKSMYITMIKNKIYLKCTGPLISSITYSFISS